MNTLNDKLTTLDEAIGAGKLQFALAFGKDLVGEFPEVQHGWMSLSEAYRLTGHLLDARMAAARAWELNPGNLFAVAQYSRCLMPFAEHRQMLVLIRAGLSCADSNDWALDILASCAVSIDEWELALRLYKRLTARQPGNAHCHYMCALALSVLGRAEQAIPVLQGIKRHPQVRGRALAQLQDIDIGLVTAEELEAVINDEHSPAQEVMAALQARGRLLHGERRYKEAFDSWQRANKLKSSGVRYNPGEWEAFAGNLKRMAGRAGKRPGGSMPTERKPLFIIGLPRSGTTLLERLLVNSGQVAALGELRDFEVVLQQQFDLPLSQMPFQFAMDDLCEPDWQQLGGQYQDRLLSRDDSARRPCDKNPFNFLFCGLILEAMPTAQIVHIKKHPLDAGLGNFRHLFAAAAPWSYRLADIAHFYQLYHEIMNHWMEQYHDSIYQIEYDDLVTDPLTQTKRLYQWLDLPWSEEIIAPRPDMGVVRSASTNQVRAPIHQNAVHHWRHYENELAPLIKTLSNAGIVNKSR